MPTLVPSTKAVWLAKVPPLAPSARMKSKPVPTKVRVRNPLSAVMTGVSTVPLNKTEDPINVVVPSSRVKVRSD